jgi:hypothetical protein
MSTTDPVRSLLSVLRGRWRVWLPSALLVSVALVQIVLARSAGLSPWKGGGFGMFASTDGTAARYVRLYVRAPERSEEVVVRPSFEGEAARARLFPSTFYLTRLARAVAARERRYQREVETVTVQVWRVVYEGHPLRAHERMIRELTVNVAQDAARRP